MSDHEWEKVDPLSGYEYSWVCSKCGAQSYLPVLPPPNHNYFYDGQWLRCDEYLIARVLDE